MGSVVGFIVFLVVVYRIVGAIKARRHRPGPVSGYAELARVVRKQDLRRTHRLAVALVTSGKPTRFAFVGADSDTVFEIGSVSKAMTGMVLGSCIEASEFTPGSTLAELYPGTLSPALGRVTVGQIATHTSGLPRLPRSPSMFLRIAAYGILGVNPYRGITAEDVMKSANHAHLSKDKKFNYSNLGASTVGNVVAAAHGVSFAELLDERLLRPLGMKDTSAAVDRHRVEPGWSNGWHARPWPQDGYAPTGGVVSTVSDVAKWCTAILDGSAPGRVALDPIVEGKGLFWMTGVGERYLWHNGETGGYSSYVAVYPERKQAVVVLADSTPAADQQRIAEAVLKANLQVDGL